MKDIKVRVSGIGIVSPWGIGVEPFWEGLIRNISPFSDSKVDVYPLQPQKAGIVDLNQYSKSDRLFEQGNKYCQMAIIAGELALQDAGVKPSSRVMGVIGGTSMGYPLIDQMGLTVSPLYSQYMYFHAAAGLVCIRNKIKGPSWTVTSGEASGALAIATGIDLIRSNQCSMVLVGASEMISRSNFLHNFSLNNLDYNNTNPHSGGLVYGKNRQGAILSEGSAYLLLENANSAEERGAKCYGEICNYATRLDTDSAYGHFHHNDSVLFETFSEVALKSQVNPGAIGLVLGAANGHKELDKMEALSLEKAMKDWGDFLITSSNSIIGNTGSVGGVLNVVSTLMMLNAKTVLPVGHQDEIPFLLNVCKKQTSLVSQYGIANAVSFGGNCISILVKKSEGLHAVPK